MSKELLPSGVLASHAPILRIQGVLLLDVSML